MLKATVSIRTVKSGELVRDGEIGYAALFAVNIGHFFHSNLIIAWTALPNRLLSAACWLAVRFKPIIGILCSFRITVSPFVLQCHSRWHQELSCHHPGGSSANIDMVLPLFCISVSVTDSKCHLLWIPTSYPFVPWISGCVKWKPITQSFQRHRGDSSDIKGAKETFCKLLCKN